MAHLSTGYAGVPDALPTQQLRRRGDRLRRRHVAVRQAERYRQGLICHRFQEWIL